MRRNISVFSYEVDNGGSRRSPGLWKGTRLYRHRRFLRFAGLSSWRFVFKVAKKLRFFWQHVKIGLLRRCIVGWGSTLKRDA